MNSIGFSDLPYDIHKIIHSYAHEISLKFIIEDSEGYNLCLKVETPLSSAKIPLMRWENDFVERTEESDQDSEDDFCCDEAITHMTVYSDKDNLSFTWEDDWEDRSFVKTKIDYISDRMMITQSSYSYNSTMTYKISHDQFKKLYMDAKMLYDACVRCESRCVPPPDILEMWREKSDI